MWAERYSGENRQRGPLDYRDPFERDRTRVIHSAAFRRLQQKTQIYGGHSGHFHRTRMTHSLEVASIGVSITRNLHHVLQSDSIKAWLPPDDLIFVICLLHDMGHPPFGHGGEAALNAYMHTFGGFESNAQTLRLATNIEKAYNPYGLDLTRRTLLGILKYPIKRSTLRLDLENNLLKEADRSLWTPHKVYYDDDQNVVEWILAGFSASDVEQFQHTVENRSVYHSFDCSIMDIADSIAYGVHDLEDAIHLRLIQRHHIENNEFVSLIQDTHLDAHEVINGLFAQDLAQKKHTIGALVHFFISSVKVCELSEFSHPLIRFQAKLTDSAQRLLNFLINQIFKQIIDSPPARAQEFGGQNLLINLFNAMLANPERLLDSASRAALHNISTHKQLTRIVCDAIANLTDDSAIRLHKKLYAENFTAQWDTSFFD